MRVLAPSPAVLLAFLLSLFILHAQAQNNYMIDGDCTADMARRVKESVDSVKRISSAALEVVADAEAEINGTPGSTAERRMSRQLVEALFGANPSSNTLMDLRFAFTGFTQLTFVEGQSHNTRDIRIYCTENRLKPSKNDKLFNTVTKTLQSTFSTCKVNPTTWGWTLAPKTNHDQLQLCPRMKKYVTDSPVLGVTDILQSTLQKWGRRFEEYFPRTNGGIEYNPIDAYKFFDATMLHELTHTKVGGTRDDVGGALRAYGWSNCRRLAARDPVGATHNADSLASFGVAAWLIKREKTFVNFETGQIGGGHSPLAKREFLTLNNLWKTFKA